MPLPLNFAITEISSIYGVLGIAVIITSCYLMIKWHKLIAVQMFLASLVVMLSAFVISRAQIAWTPFAERYMYIPSLFFACAVVDTFSSLSRFFSVRNATLILFIFLVCIAGITAHRAEIWQDNLTLYQDTQKKSPNFASINNELAIALIENSKFTEAAEQIERGKKTTNGGNMPLLFVNQALMYGNKKMYAEAYRVLDSSYKQGTIEAADIEIIKTYINLMELEKIYSKDRRRALRINPKLVVLHELYYKRSGDSDHLYRAAQLELAGNNKKHAHELFEKVAEVAPKESMYKNFARKMALKTEPVPKSN